jgi:hypothetical protein
MTIIGTKVQKYTTTVLMFSLFMAGVARAAAPAWTGVARSCRANPPVAGEKDSLPDGASSLVGAILSVQGSEAMVLAYPGNSYQNYAADYPYVCLVVGDFSKQGTPHEGQWLAILGERASYSDYVLYGGEAVPYTDPAGTGGYTGGGPATTGFSAPFQFCNGNNVPLPALRSIVPRSCLEQAFEQAWSARCLTYPYTRNHPTLLIFDGLYNSTGQYCPVNYGGQIAATVCADGSIHNGVASCG